MDKQYIKVQSVYSKIKQSDTQNKIIYISGPIGSGKTVAVKNYLKNRQYIYMSGRNGYIDNQVDITSIQGKYIVIDDISWINDKNSIEYVVNIVRQYDKCILIGRSNVPTWLKMLCIQKKFKVTDLNDLLLSEKNIKELLQSYEINITNDEVTLIYYDTLGYAISIELIAYRMVGGHSYSSVILNNATIDVFHYLDIELYDAWDNEIKNFLLDVCAFEKFTIELAEMVTGSQDVLMYIEKIQSIGGFLLLVDTGTYSILKLMRRFLLWKRNLSYEKDKINNIYNNAGLYYELKHMTIEALEAYKISDNQSKISEILERNAKLHPGLAYFYETRNYYKSLPDKMICKSPILMSGICMMYSVLMEPEESDKWYKKLEEFISEQRSNSTIKKEAKIRLMYLDIALPHRGSLKISEMLKNVAMFCMNKSVMMPEFSVTSNLPSLMNGGKDFCEWSKNDIILAKTLKKPIEIVLGKNGCGLVNIALSESVFEKQSMNTYEIITMLNSGLTISETKGNMEISFAAIGILVRLHISQRQYQVAYSILEDFKQKVINNCKTYLLPNINAMLVWLNLLNGKLSLPKEWVENEAPSENIDFYIMERYRYIIKIRYYIANGQYEFAANLIERLSIYFKEYSRFYMSIQNSLLRAIVKYRMGFKDWEISLNEALKIAENYKFVRVIAEEGIAIKELIDKSKNLEVSPAYLKKVKKAVNEMAQYYPKYLKPINKLKEELTNTEAKILHMLCDGLSIDEICKICCISNSTVKFHNSNIYRKLGVKSRHEAEKVANELDLC